MPGTADKFLVVINPRHERHVALARALVSAGLRETVPHIHLFVSTDEPPRGGAFLSSDLLQSLVAQLDEKNIPHSYEFCWTENVENSLLAAAQRYQATMILYPFDEASARKHQGFTLARWELLRNSDCPVILVKPDYGKHRNRLLAAVNFQSVYPEYVELNRRILERALWLSEKHGAELYVVNAYESMDDYPDFEKIQEQSGLPHDHIKLVEGSPEKVLASTAKELGIDLLLIGTRNSTDIASKFRRNTAEKVSASLHTDIMVLN